MSKQVVRFPQNPGKNGRPMSVPTRTEHTDSQISQLLACLSVLTPYVLGPQGEHTFGGPTDGGIPMAVENTVVGVCARLDKLVADDERWHTIDTDKVVESLKRTIDIQGVAAMEEAKAYALARAPHVVFHAKLVRHKETGIWICAAGNEAEGSLIVGQGMTPGAACQAFDEEFYGQQQQQASPKSVPVAPDLDAGGGSSAEIPQDMPGGGEGSKAGVSDGKGDRPTVGPHAPRSGPPGRTRGKRIRGKRIR